MPVSADILQKQHYLAGSDKAGYHPVGSWTAVLAQLQQQERE
jgi:hypothetical protein